MEPISALLTVGSKLIDKLFPDPAQKAQAQLELMKLEQSGELEAMKTQLSAIIAEAQSQDPYTSRARPSFLYVMYVLLLWSIPMGILFAFQPEIAEKISKGMTSYLSSIPDGLYALFGTGYLGYTAAREYGKTKGTTK